MAATQLGTGGLPSDPPVEMLQWVRGTGESRTIEYRGERSVVLAEYESLKSNNATSQLDYTRQEGRTRLVAKFVREDVSGETGPDGVTIIEELYGQDITRSIFAAPAWAALSDDDLNEVARAVEDKTPDDAIVGYSGWANAKKELRWQMIHGQESYLETLFMLRVRKQGVRSSALRGSFTGINTVVALPSLSSGMTELVGTLPAGEWLYKPPQVTYAGRGIWSVSTEYHWSVKWSVIYGGTKKGFL